jgi:hypothetical protein
LASAASTSASAWSSSPSCSPRRTISVGLLLSELTELTLDLAPELTLEPAPELALDLAPELALELGLAPEALRLRSSPPVGHGVQPPLPLPPPPLTLPPPPLTLPPPPLTLPPPPSLLPLLADFGPIRTRNS